MIAHRFAPLKQADKIGVMEKGKLINLGSIEELYQKSEIYRQLLAKQK